VFFSASVAETRFNGQDWTKKTSRNSTSEQFLEFNSLYRLFLEF